MTSETRLLLGRIDFYKEHSDTTMLVQDDYGVNIMYDCAMADMRVLEQEMLLIISYFINKIEPTQDTSDLRNLMPTCDRLGMIREIIMLEEKY